MTETKKVVAQVEQEEAESDPSLSDSIQDIIDQLDADNEKTKQELEEKKNKYRRLQDKLSKIPDKIEELFGHIIFYMEEGLTQAMIDADVQQALKDARYWDRVVLWKEQQIRDYPDTHPGITTMELEIQKDTAIRERDRFLLMSIRPPQPTR